MNIVLDGKKMKNLKLTHDYLKEKFGFPDYYGGNLDALWDVLTDIDDDMNIVIKNSRSIENCLGDYSFGLIQTFKDLEKEKSNIKLVIEE